MKKILIMILSILLCFVFFDTSLYAEEDEFDSYVRNHFIDFLQTENLDINEITIKAGIKLTGNDNDTIKAKFYPVYYKNKLELVFEVYNVNNELCATLSGNMVENLKTLFVFSKGSLGIVEDNGYLYGYTENICLDFKTGKVSESLSTLKMLNNYSPYSLDFYPSQENEAAFIDNHIMSIPSWTPYWNSYGYNSYCVPQCLYNIFKNYGKSISSWTVISNEMDSVNNITYSFGLYGHTDITNYLSSKGAYYPYYSNSGKLSYNTCDSILSLNRYILAISTGNDGTSKHATVIIGPYTTNGIQYIKMFDPHGSTSTRIFNTTYSSPVFYTDGSTFTWNSGYYSHMTY